MSIIRRTRSVAAVLGKFEDANEAISAPRLVDEFRHEMNRTTVYRILERLENDGSLHSFTGKDGLRWYARQGAVPAANGIDTHPHFQCRDCGKTECISVDVRIPLLPDRKVDNAELLLIGICTECLEVSSRKSQWTH